MKRKTTKSRKQRARHVQKGIGWQLRRSRDLCRVLRASWVK
jgi:uncharacterized C2H2 Zn-finger protein